ncbi:MAG: hypothetical protein ACLFUB_01230 [Cyclobacteriaceae bacterium]
MKKTKLEQLSDEELRKEFRQHNIRGVFLSLLLLGIFLLLYLVPLGIDPALLNNIFIVLILFSAGFGLWYNLRKRKYFKEFRRRNTKF